MALLRHKVVEEQLRPVFPPGSAPIYVALAKLCWSPSVADRSVRYAAS